jgi:short-subunit dehydrogenase
VKERGWKTVWITGASSGIGQELAKLMDVAADHVVISARSVNKLEALSERSRAIAPFPLDVTDAEAVSVCVKTIEVTAGPIDLAVLNAGAWTLMDAQHLELQAVRTGIEVNYMGVMNAIDALIPPMIERRRGHIAIVASVAGYRGLPRSIAYGPTKAALNNLAEILRLELEPHGITISVINPGFVDTPMTQNNPFPMPSIVSAEEAAKQILEGLKRRQFEIAFPRGFIMVMKMMQLMPLVLYFWLVRKIVMRGKA